MSELDTNRPYQIEFLIRDEELNRLNDRLNTIEKLAKQSMSNYEKVDYVVDIYPDSATFSSSQLLKLSISGNLDSIDRYIDCYYKHIERLEPKNIYKFVRLRDDLGKEIRAKSFPILAEIEQLLRSFIGENLFLIGEVFEALENTSETDSKRFRDFAKCSYLETTTLENLKDFITKPFSKWEKAVDIEKIREMITESSSISQINKILDENTQEHTVLGVIFDAYLNLSKKDIEVRKETFTALINKIVLLRNAVMHHRPVNVGQFKLLKKSRDEILTFLEEVSNTTLDAARARKAKEEIENIMPNLILFKQSFNFPEGLMESFQNIKLENVSEYARKNLEPALSAITSALESRIAMQLKESIKNTEELNKSEIEEE